MSSHEQEQGQPGESKSKVKVVRNAKGEVQWDAQVVEGTTKEELDRIRTLAVETHRALMNDLVGAPEPGPKT